MALRLWLGAFAALYASAPSAVSDACGGPVGTLPLSTPLQGHTRARRKEARLQSARRQVQNPVAARLERTQALQRYGVGYARAERRKI